MRATIAELNDPSYDLPMRALHTEIVHDPAPAADHTTRLDEPPQVLWSRAHTLAPCLTRVRS